MLLAFICDRLAPFKFVSLLFSSSFVLESFFSLFSFHFSCLLHPTFRTLYSEYRFTLLHEENIEFKDFGLRDNVAQLCVLKVLGG